MANAKILEVASAKYGDLLKQRTALKEYGISHDTLKAMEALGKVKPIRLKFVKGILYKREEIEEALLEPID